MSIAALVFGIVVALASLHPKTTRIVYSAISRGWHWPGVPLLGIRISLLILGIGCIVLSFILPSQARNSPAAQPSFTTAPQQQTTTDTADVEQEGRLVLTGIMQHTPAGKSPRTVPLSDAHSWLPELSTSDYSLLPYPEYASVGMFYISSPLYPLAKNVCVSVPNQILTTAQIQAGNYVGTGSFCDQ